MGGMPGFLFESSGDCPVPALAILVGISLAQLSMFLGMSLAQFLVFLGMSLAQLLIDPGLAKMKNLIICENI